MRLTIAFISGILISEAYGREFILPLTFLLVTGAILIIATYLYGLVFNFRIRWIYGTLIIIFMMGSGWFMAQNKALKEQKCLIEVPADTSPCIGIIKEGFELRERSCKGRVALIATKDSISYNPVSAEVMVYTEVDSLLSDVKVGSYILMEASIKTTSPPLNPGEFDYKKYLSRQGIYHSTYLRAGQWKLIGKSSGFNLNHMASQIRNSLLVKLKENGVVDRHFSVSSALLLGDDSYLGDEIRNMYSRAGAMHILCVSGLHVGVIYLVLSTIFGFLNKLKAGRIILPLLLILSIWAYALITGLAPPVMRASCMISFIIVGRLLSRHKNVYNTLTAAGLLMLLIDPYVIFSAGFQLSYSAVLGIVFLQQPLYNMIYSKYLILHKIWAITAVSIAAQLGTLPVVLYYFHQFPVYSLLTNLIVIPLSSLIIYSGLLLFILPSLSLAASAASWLLNLLISVMDTGVTLVEALPSAAMTEIHFDLFMTIASYLLIIFFSFFLIRKHSALLFAALTIALIISCHRLLLSLEQTKQNLFIVYCVNGHSAYDIIHGNEHVFVADSSILVNEGKIDYSIKPNWQDLALEPATIQLLSAGSGNINACGTCEMLYDNGKRIAVWQGRLPDYQDSELKLGLDYLILRSHCRVDINKLIMWFDPKLIILDSSIPWWKAKKMNDADIGVPIWDVKENGAFVRGTDELHRMNKQE